MGTNPDAASARLVDPFDITFFWPLRLERLDRPKRPLRADVKRALCGGGWEQLKDLVRRNGHPEEDGFAYAEMVYFHPFVQKFLYGETAGQPDGRARASHFDLFHCPKLVGTTLEIVEDTWGEAFTIREVLFHAFESDIAFLTLRLTAMKPVPWSNALNTISLMRTVHFQHYEQDEVEGGSEGARVAVWKGGGGIGGVRIERTGSGVDENQADRTTELQQALKTLEPVLYRHWRDMLQPLLDASIKPRPLGDHRIPLMGFLGLEDPATLSPDEWFGLSEADSASFPTYGPAFLDKALAEATYDRWWDKTNPRLRHRYLAGPLTYLSVLSAPQEGRPEWFDRLRTSWRRQHYQTFLLAHYQRAVLLDLQDQIARAAAKTGRDDAELLSEVAGIQREMAVFSSSRSFLEITPQVQGQELYLLLRKRLRLDDLYNGVMEDKALLGNWLLAREEQQTAQRWATINLWMVPLGLALTLLGANVIVSPLQCLLKDFRPWWSALQRDVALTAVFVLSALLLARFYHWWLKRNQKGP